MEQRKKVKKAEPAKKILKEDPCMKDGSVCLYKEHVPVGDYGIGEGVKLQQETEPELNIDSGEIYEATSKLLFRKGSELLLFLVSNMQKHHSTPMNYSTIYLQQKIASDELAHEYLVDTEITPRKQALYFLPKRALTRNLYHVVTEDKRNVNAWIVSLQTLENIYQKDQMGVDLGFDPNLSVLCFSEEDAKLIARNINAAIDIHGKDFFTKPLFNKPLNDIDHNDLITLAKNEIFTLQNKLYNDKTALMRIIELSNGTMTTKMHDLRDNSKLLPVLSKCILMDFASKNTATEIHTDMIDLMNSIMQLDVLYREHDKVNVNGKIKADANEFSQIKNELIDSANAYMQKPLREYIDTIISKINHYCLNERIPFEKATVLKMYFLDNLSQVDLNKIYTSAPKNKSGIFDVEVKQDQIKSILNKQLGTDQIEKYLEKIISPTKEIIKQDMKPSTRK